MFTTFRHSVTEYDEQGLAIINAAVFDGDSERLLEGPVVMRFGRVESIGERYRPGDRVIDARGGTVVPGLIDAHCHAYAAGHNTLDLEASWLSYVALVGATRLRAALHRGFTTIRDVAGGDAGLARAVEEGHLESPRYLFTGPGLSQTGGHGDPRPGHWDICALSGHTAEVVDGVENLRVAARERLRQGAHAIKIMASGGVVSPTDPLRPPQYSGEEIRAVTGEAARRGSYVAAHAYSPESIAHAVRNGVRSIEHGNLLDTASAQLMREHDAFLIPTLAAYDAMDRLGHVMGLAEYAREKNREVLRAGLGSLETAISEGVEVGFGSDLMGPFETEQLQGLRLQAEVMGVLETLRSATSRNARLLGLEGVGRITVGGPADVLLLPGDPFSDPSCLWTQRPGRHVVQAGRVVAGTD